MSDENTQPEENTRPKAQEKEATEKEAQETRVIMVTTSQKQFYDAMLRQFQAMDNAIYAAEILCHHGSGGTMRCTDCEMVPIVCPFRAMNFPYLNRIRIIRANIGDHIQNGDPTLHASKGPCIWGVPLNDGETVQCIRSGNKDCNESIRKDGNRVCTRDYWS